MGVCASKINILIARIHSQMVSRNITEIIEIRKSYLMSKEQYG